MDVLDGGGSLCNSEWLEEKVSDNWPVRPDVAEAVVILDEYIEVVL